MPMLEGVGVAGVLGWPCLPGRARLVDQVVRDYQEVDMLKDLKQPVVRPAPCHTWTQPVSLSDLDWHGNVNNVRMISWIQDSWNDMVSPGRGQPPSFAVVGHEVRYLEPLLYQPAVEIQTVVTTLRRSTVIGTARILDGSRVFAEVTTRWAAVDVEEHRLRPVTDAERANLAKYYVESDPSTTAA
ncbi:acyl-CoA thioesterase [Streptomyces sp. NPDC048527]|uniref:acyl-CoA thioesterase n=1 Tax=Streptomyces sp. NPDC048527 TaxID=3365568 RepID=UPI00371986B7